MLAYGECEEAGGLGFDGLDQWYTGPSVFLLSTSQDSDATHHVPNTGQNYPWKAVTAGPHTEGCEVSSLAPAGPSQGLCTSQRQQDTAAGFSQQLQEEGLCTKLIQSATSTISQRR